MGSLMARALMASIVQHAQSHGSPTSGNARRTSGFPVAGLDALFNPDGGSNRNQDDDSLGTEMANETSRWAGLTYRKGSAVRWRPTLRKPKRGWQGSSKLSVGFVKSRDEKSGAVIVSFPSKSTVTAEPGELVVDEDAEKIRPGILVHVRQQLDQPAYGWGNVDNKSVGMVRDVKKDGEVEVDFVEAPGGWRCLLTELEPIPTDVEEAARRELKLEATVGLYTFPIGSAVRVKPTVEEPRHQWGQVRPGSVGRVAGVSSGTAQLLVNFPETDHWRAHPEDIEIFTMSNAVRSGTNVCVRRNVTRPRYDWPDGVSHDTVGCVANLLYDGRATVKFEGCRYPEREYMFQLKELQPAGWAEHIGEHDSTVNNVASKSSSSSSVGGSSSSCGNRKSPSKRSEVESNRVPPAVPFPDDVTLGILCPITLDVMRDPVFAADGETYERAAIVSHFASLKEAGKPIKSPMTNQVVDPSILIPNRAMFRLLAECEKNMAIVGHSRSTLDNAPLGVDAGARPVSLSMPRSSSSSSSCSSSSPISSSAVAQDARPTDGNTIRRNSSSGRKRVASKMASEQATASQRGMPSSSSSATKRSCTRRKNNGAANATSRSSSSDLSSSASLEGANVAHATTTSKRSSKRLKELAKT